MKKMALATLLLILGLMLCIPAGSMAADSKVYTFNVAWVNWSPLYRCTQVFRPGGEFQRMLHERSGGRIKLNIVSKMFPSKEILPALIEGRVDIGEVMWPYYSGTYPHMLWQDVPGVISEDPQESRGEELAVFNDSKFLKLWNGKHKELGLKHLFLAQGGSGNLICAKKPINKLSDLKGMKIRVYGFIPTLGINALGGVATSVPLEEIETALLTGTVDAVLTGPLLANSIGLAKLAPKMTFVPLSPTWLDTCAMNLEKFNSMPPDLQKIFLEVGQEISRMVSMANTAEILMGVQSLKNSGATIATLSPDEHKKAVEMLAPIKAKWLDISGDDGKAILDAATAAVQNYRNFNPHAK